MAVSDLLCSPKDGLNELVVQYNKTLSNLLDKHALLKIGTVITQHVTPWYNKAIYTAKIERRKCEACWR